MKALRIHQHGGPEVLQLDEIPRPEPGPGEVLVRVLAASVNHLDIWVRRGMPGFPVPFPRILGCDGTGEVAGLGAGVTAWKVGQKVVLEPGYTKGDARLEQEGTDHFEPDYEIRGEHCDGFHAEYVVLPERFLLALPEGLDPVAAAAVPLVFLTAWGMLERACLERGETVLVIGGASGVGSAAIQIARQRGARVLSTAGSEAKRALCLELGAEAAVDHRQKDWPKEIRTLTGGRGADVVVEHVGPATWVGSMRSLARLGRLVTCGGTTGPTVEVTLPHLFIKNQSILGSTMGPASALPTIFAHVARGIWKPVVHRVMPVSEAKEAHTRLEASDVVGKIVLVPGS